MAAVPPPLAGRRHHHVRAQACRTVSRALYAKAPRRRVSLNAGRSLASIGTQPTTAKGRRKRAAMGRQVGLSSRQLRTSPHGCPSRGVTVGSFLAPAQRRDGELRRSADQGFNTGNNAEFDGRLRDAAAVALPAIRPGCCSSACRFGTTARQTRLTHFRDRGEYAVGKMRTVRSRRQRSRRW